MTLKEVSSENQFEVYYQSHKLQTTTDKINYLKNEMKIRAVLYDEDETPEEILADLEEAALFGCWKASS